MVLSKNSIFVQKLLEALDLDPFEARCIDLHMPADGLIEVTIKRFISKDELDRLVELLSEDGKQKQTEYTKESIEKLKKAVDDEVLRKLGVHVNYE